jgi:hypothetical protein
MNCPSIGYGGGFFRAKTRFPGLFEQSAFGGQGFATLNAYLVLTARPIKSAKIYLK